MFHFLLFRMSSIDVRDEWRRCGVILNVTKWQWELHKEETRVLSVDELLVIEISFIEMQYYIDKCTHDVDNLIGFYDRLKSINEKLRAAAFKMGFNVKNLSGENF